MPISGMDDKAGVAGALTENHAIDVRQRSRKRAGRVIWLRFPGQQDWLHSSDFRARFNNRQRKQSTANLEKSKAVQNDGAGRSKSVQGFHEKGDIGLSCGPFS